MVLSENNEDSTQGQHCKALTEQHSTVRIKMA